MQKLQIKNIFILSILFLFIFWVVSLAPAQQKIDNFLVYLLFSGNTIFVIYF